MIVFGKNSEWGISVDDHCLQFHPNLIDAPQAKATHIWREAWEKVEELGGFDAVVERLYAKRSRPMN